MTKEIWLPVNGFEDKYEISNYGNVKRIDTQCLLKPQKNTHGYLCVQLYKNGMHRFSVHRLVALHFIDNPDKLPMVNHKDEDKTNNYYENLEWCTAAYNMSYSGIHILSRNATSKAVVVYDKDGNFIAEFSSQNQAAKAFNTFSSLVSRCCKNKTCSVKGLLFRFKDDIDILQQSNPHYRRVDMYDKDNNFIRSFNTMREAAIYLGHPKSESNIIANLKGRTKTAFGYIFKSAK